MFYNKILQILSLDLSFLLPFIARFLNGILCCNVCVIVMALYLRV